MNNYEILVFFLLMVIIFGVFTNSGCRCKCTGANGNYRKMQSSNYPPPREQCEKITPPKGGSGTAPPQQDVRCPHCREFHKVDVLPTGQTKIIECWKCDMSFKYCTPSRRTIRLLPMGGSTNNPPENGATNAS